MRLIRSTGLILGLALASCPAGAGAAEPNLKGKPFPHYSAKYDHDSQGWSKLVDDWRAVNCGAPRPERAGFTSGHKFQKADAIWQACNPPVPAPPPPPPPSGNHPDKN